MAGITRFGHPTFKVEVVNRILLVDPWLDKNPSMPVKFSNEFVESVKEKMLKVKVVVLKSGENWEA